MRASALVSDITMRARSEGVAETTAKLEKLGKANDAVLVSADKAEKRQLSLANAYDRLQRSIDVNYRMQKQFESGQKILTASLNSGRISAEGYHRSLDLLRSKYGDVAQASARLSLIVFWRVRRRSRVSSPANSASELAS